MFGRCPAGWMALLSALSVGCGGRASGLANSGGARFDAGTDGSSVTAGGPNGGSSGGSSNGSSGGSGGPSPADAGAVQLRTRGVDKVDLLFMIDNSSSMGEKQALLAAAVPDLIGRLVSPNCVDASGNSLGPSTNNGCATGRLEFPPVHDMHIGIVTSSLGGRGGDQCQPGESNPADTSLSAHTDDRGELIARAGAAEATASDAVPDDFLGWFPPVQTNEGAMPPPGTPVASLGTLEGDLQSMVQGVHDQGCGYEAQNEAWYRFLAQPDPYDHVQVTNNRASYVGVDETILRQRADFLRPDSLVVVIVVSGKPERVADPLSIAGQGWVFSNSQFPGSPNYAAPEGTIECSKQDPNNLATTGPNDPNCTSCAFIKNDPNFATRCPADPPNGSGGFLDPTDDGLAVRFFQQKRRFGVFVGYPASRYLRALRMLAVPDAAHERDGNGNYVGDQDSQANCVNPLFAANLPTSSSADLCGLQRGPRTPDLVYYAAISGVPHQLLQQDPTNPDSPQKDTLSEADWLKITGRDPEHYDFTGADFHMVESELPRTAGNLPPGVANASACPVGSSDACDPINGRERDTSKGDLQFACIFALPQPRDCGVQSAPAPNTCDCQHPEYQKTPLCQAGDGGSPTLQVASRVYPTVRAMVLAHAMGTQGVVSSLCPIHTTPANGDSPPDPLYGYRPAMTAIVDRIRGGLAPACMPQKLATDPATQSVPCVVLVTPPGVGSCTKPTCDSTQGLTVPPRAVVDAFCSAQESAYNQAGGVNSGLPDPAQQNVCLLTQLTSVNNPAAFVSGSCANPPDNSLGWCYVEGAAAGSCPQAILFTSSEPPRGSSVYLRCM